MIRDIRVESAECRVQNEGKNGVTVQDIRVECGEWRVERRNERRNRSGY